MNFRICVGWVVVCGRLGGWRSGRLCATRGQTDIRGLGTAGPWFVVGSRCLRSGVASPGGGGLLIVESRVPRALPGRHRPSRRDRSVCGLRGYSIWVIAQQKPASSRAAATAMIVRRLARASRRVQVRCRRRCALQATAIASGGLVLLAVAERAADARAGAVVPRRLDQQPPRVPGAGLGDRAEPALLPGRVLARDQPDVAHQLLGAGEALEVADLRAQPDRGQRVDAAQAAQPRRPAPPTARPGSIATISRSELSRRCASASIAPRASSSVACAAGQSSSTVASHWR